MNIYDEEKTVKKLSLAPVKVKKHVGNNQGYYGKVLMWV